MSRTHCQAPSRAPHLGRLAESLSEGFRGSARPSTTAMPTFPFEGIDLLKAAGYFAAPIPVEHGGLGVDISSMTSSSRRAGSRAATPRSRSA